MDISGLLRNGASYARYVAELQGDSNHLKDADEMESAAKIIDRLILLGQQLQVFGHNSIDGVQGDKVTVGQQSLRALLDALYEIE